MMEDKKRKKLGLRLKNAKKMTVTKSEVSEQRLTKTSSSTNSREQKDASVLDAGRSSCLEECGSKRKIKPSINPLRKENLLPVDDEEEHERILWKTLFSVNGSMNWETMEDLPISNVSHASGKAHESSSSMEKTGSIKKENSNTISSLLSSNRETATFEINLDYKELPKPCIGCYTRKPCSLTWSQDDDDQRIEENDIYDINCISPKDPALDMNSSISIKRTSQNKLGSNTLFQRKSESLKSEANAKPVTLLNQHVECKKKIIVQKNLNKFQAVKNNTGYFSHISSEGKSQKSAKNNALFSLTTTDTFIDLTSDNLEEQKLVNGQRIGVSEDFTYSTREHTFNKQNKHAFHKTPTGLTNADLKVESKKPSTTLVDSGAKGNVAVGKKEILKCCPICQFQFPQRMNRQGIDQHISSCIGNEEFFMDDDEEEDW